MGGRWEIEDYWISKDTIKSVLTCCWREGLLPAALPRNRAKTFFKPSVPTPSLDPLSNEKQTVPQNKILKIFSKTEVQLLDVEETNCAHYCRNQNKLYFIPFKFKICFLLKSLFYFFSSIIGLFKGKLLKAASRMRENYFSIIMFIFR